VQPSSMHAALQGPTRCRVLLRLRRAGVERPTVVVHDPAVAAGVRIARCVISRSCDRPVEFVNHVSDRSPEKATS
ncbi:MAG: hypothetical protein WBV98_21020, partial [Candidatus Sulfotelmatobacter sp.]